MNSENGGEIYENDELIDPITNGYVSAVPTVTTPEPVTLGLLSLGFVGIGALRRKVRVA